MLMHASGAAGTVVHFQLTVYTVIRQQITLPMLNIYVFLFFLFFCVHITHTHAREPTDCLVSIIMTPNYVISKFII